MKTKCLRKTVKTGERVQHFWAFDDKGRAVGARITTGTAEFYAAPANTMAATSDEIPGSYFWAKLHGVRNLNNYGPAPDKKFFTTEQDRDEWVSKTFDKMAKAARAKWRKVAK